MASLVSLAKEGKLPEIQHMDAETLAWIEETGRTIGLERRTADIPPIIRKSIEKYVPERGWFLNQECYDSLHGIRHILRVVVNAANLAKNRGLGIRSTRNLLIACALHDVRRENDKGDLGHSRRAVDWLVENVVLINNHFSIDLTAEDLAEVSAVIYLHEVPYSDIGDLEEYRRHKVVVDLIKTADALDRYRLPKFSWWINDDFLILRPLLEEKGLAFNLVVASEKEYLQTGGSYLSILNNL